MASVLRAMAGFSAPADMPSLATFAESTRVKYFLLHWTDLFGVGRSKLVPVSAISAMEQNGAGFAGFSCYMDMTPADPDMFAIPDPESALVLPWKPDIAWVACDLIMDGRPVEQAPRNVLKVQVGEARKKGYQMKTGVECEFFLLEASGKPEVADVLDVATKPCYDQAALMRKFDVLAEICDCMAQLGWKPYQNDHEDGNGQFEMNWEYDDCLVTADRHVFFKFMTKAIAEKHGMRATFMPKPFSTRTGNGAHCHVSIWDVGGSNLFEDLKGELGLSKLAYVFIGGVLAHAPGSGAQFSDGPDARSGFQAMCAITNPSVNSYKRIDGVTTVTGSSWAPATVSYTGNNRTHMLRIPDIGRFEFRLPDGAVNPYLLQACLLAAGLDGIANSTSAGPRADYNGHSPPPGITLPALPANLMDALRLLEDSQTLREALGAEFVEAYLKLKKQQWRAYTSHLSQWELDNTLDC